VDRPGAITSTPAVAVKTEEDSHPLSPTTSKSNDQDKKAEAERRFDARSMIQKQIKLAAKSLQPEVRTKPTISSPTFKPEPAVEELAAKGINYIPAQVNDNRHQLHCHLTEFFFSSTVSWCVGRCGTCTAIFRDADSLSFYHQFSPSIDRSPSQKDAFRVWGD
jgi:hypothetical protein